MSNKVELGESMPFRADPQTLRTFGGSAADLAAQAEQARAYASRHLAISSGQGHIFANVVAQAAELRGVLETNYAQMARLLGTSGAELHRTAAKFERLDEDGARALDARSSSGPR